MKYLLLIASFTFLVSCSSQWSAENCKTTNFSSLGFQEGSSGQDNNVAAYSQACLKSKVNINAGNYNQGYQKGLQAFCSTQKGLSDGSRGVQAHKNCLMITPFMKSYEKGLRSFCSVERGSTDGYNMSGKNSLCVPFRAYNIGYTKGAKNFCSFEKGQEDGFSGDGMNSSCSGYSSYVSGYKKGQKNFCSPDNAYRLGEAGKSVPSQCKDNRSFYSSYKKGRTLFLKEALKRKELAITYEKQNYERVRDELQDKQFAFNNLPRYPRTAEERRRRSYLQQEISRVQKKRDAQRKAVDQMERDIMILRDELRSL